MTTTPTARVSLRSMFADTVQKHPERPAITYPLGPTSDQPRGLGTHQRRTLTWHEVAALVLDVARALEQSPETRAARTVALFSDTDARYPLLELAVVLTGRVFQPLYVTSTDEELVDALATSAAEVLFVGRSQAERARAGRLHATTVALEAIVRLPGIDGAPHAALPPHVEPFETRAILAGLAELPPPGPSMLYLQSTGTTGPARVIDLSESALMAGVRSVEGEASHRFPRLLSFLPTAHISERLLTLYVSIALGGHTFYGGGLATLAEDLRACRPTILLAPPLLLETIRAEALAAARATGLGRRLLGCVQDTADAMLAGRVVGRGRRSLGARLFGRKLRRDAGLDEVRDALTGTAPVPASLHAWFEAVGLPLRIIYGQTEIAGATSITARTGATFGAVGVLAPGIESRLSERGELLVRADATLTRYVGDAAATTRTLEGAWFHSGDRATLLPSGEIALLGRVQSLLTAADGATVDASQIASRLKESLGAADVVVARDDGTRDAYLYVAIPTSTSTSTSTSPAARPVPATDARWEQLAAAVAVADPHQVVKGWALFDGTFTQATGEVGPTGKPRAWRIHSLRSSALRPRTPATTLRPSSNVERSMAPTARAR